LFTFSGQAAESTGNSTIIATTAIVTPVTSISELTPTFIATSVPTATKIATISITTDPVVTPTSAEAQVGASGIPNPTDAVAVSRAGGTLQPSAVAESQQRDDTATRAFTSVSIQAPGGQCLFVDPTAGDFRENLIPVSLVTCGGTPNEKFDVITAGVHNNAQNSALIVSSLVCAVFSHAQMIHYTYLSIDTRMYKLRWAASCR
jgi:hypothetical protein